MAKLPALISAMVHVDGRDREAIDHIGRMIRERGYIPTGKRGGGAADMTVREAANLIIALNGADGAKDAPLAIDRFRSLRPLWIVGKGKSGSKALEQFDSYPAPIQEIMGVQTFGEALEALIEGVPILMASFHQYVSDAYPNSDTDTVFEPMLKLGQFGLDITLDRYCAKLELFTFDGSAKRTDFESKFVMDDDRFLSGFYGNFGRTVDRKVSVKFGMMTLIAAWRVLNTETHEDASLASDA